MGNLGGSEILVILLVALIVLGPDKLPDAARQAGKLMNQFRRLSTDFRAEFETAIMQPDDDPTALPGSEPYRDRDDAETLATEAAARAKGDALVADADRPISDGVSTDGASDDSDDEAPAPNPASMAYRPEQSSYLAIDPTRAAGADAAQPESAAQPKEPEPDAPAEATAATSDAPAPDSSEDSQP